ncbi:MAG TPA: T9SS type A sorting domain-containing protein [Ignavibacteriales bacterium]|nr:T9SS type A sorting domain-containing protein [Ignavibacteriales bacterium]
MKPITMLLMLCYIFLNSSVNFASAYSSTGYPEAPLAIGVPQLYSPADQSTDRPLSQTLSWSAVSEAVSYEVQTANDSLFYSGVKDTVVTTTYRELWWLQNNRKYFWRVKAIDFFGQASEWSVTWGFTTVAAAPPKPVLQSPSNGLTGQPQSILFKWYPADGAKIYTLELAADTFFTNVTHHVDTLRTNSMQISGLKSGMKYFWRVNAYNRGGLSDWSDVWKVSVALAQTPLLSPANSSTNQPLNVTLQWKPVPFADSYDLQVSTIPAVSSIFFEDKDVKETSREIPQLSNSTTYYWRVRAKQGGNTGIFSDIWNFTTIKPLPGVPVLASPADGATFQPLSITLMWNTAPNALMYYLQVSEKDDFSAIIFEDSTITRTSQQISSLNFGTRYYWRVRAKNITGTSQFSNVCSFVTLLPAPETLAASSHGLMKVKLTWAESSYNEQGFIIERKSTGSFSVIDSTGANATSFIDSTVEMGTAYIYRVRTFNSAALSQYSNEASVTTIVSVQTKEGLLPLEFDLFQNYPNPFNPSTRISYAIPFESDVKLTVYNSLGKVVRELVNGIQHQGVYEVRFEANDLPSGLYFFAIDARSPLNGKEFKSVKKMLLVK